jgi:hypothetical protein
MCVYVRDSALPHPNHYLDGIVASATAFYVCVDNKIRIFYFLFRLIYTYTHNVGTVLSSSVLKAFPENLCSVTKRAVG